jgi:5-methylcytosine-specific restriction endonuclease McrA
MPYKDPKEATAAKLRWAKANREKVRAASKKYYEANKENLRADHKKHYEANKERKSSYHKERYKNNKEKINASNKKWAQANPAKVNAKGARYRANKAQRTPSWANIKQIERVYMLASWASKFTGKALEVDHIIPLQGKTVCGLHVQTNLQILTLSENRIKNNRLILCSI